MSQEARPSGESSPGDIDQFNAEANGELLSMRELQAHVGLCLRNQEAIHGRLDAILDFLQDKVVNQIDAHTETFSTLGEWCLEIHGLIHDIQKSTKGSSLSADKWLLQQATKRVQDNLDKSKESNERSMG